MTYREHFRAILRLGLPLIGGHVAQMAIALTDTVMLGWYSVEALAAVAIGSSVFFTLFIFGSGFAMGVMSLVAEASARDDTTSIRRSARMAIWLSIAFGVVILPIFVYSGPLLSALGQVPEVVSTGEAYLRIAGWGMLPALLVMVLKNYLAALEKTQVVLWVSVGAAVLNALVNYLLIFGNFGFPEMGAQGAAVASVTVQVFSVLAALLYAMRVFPDHRLLQRIWKIDGVFLSRVFRLGAPIGLTMLLESALFSGSSIMVGWLGTTQLAAHGVAMQISALFFIVHVGLANVATVRAGNALGRRDSEHLARGARAVIVVMLVLAFAAIILFLTIPDLLMSPFIDPSEPNRDLIIKVGASYLAILALFHIADAAQVVALGLLRGAMDTRIPMIMAAFSYWIVGIPCAYILGFVVGLEGVGVWLGLTSGLICAGFLMMGRFWRVILVRLRSTLASA